jgi:site-specific recombinase XerD
LIYKSKSSNPFLVLALIYSSFISVLFIFGTYKLSHELIETLGSLDTKNKGYIFPAITDKNKKMNKGTIRNHWDKVLKQVNINIRMHDLRHLIGGTLVSNGKTLEQVASVLGHTSTSVTKRYSKVRQEVAAESLDDFFKRVR